MCILARLKYRVPLAFLCWHILRMPAETRQSPGSLPAAAPASSLPFSFSFCPGLKWCPRGRHKELDCGLSHSRGPQRAPQIPALALCSSLSIQVRVFAFVGRRGSRYSGLVLVPEKPGEVCAHSVAPGGGKCQAQYQLAPRIFQGGPNFLFFFKKGMGMPGWLNRLNVQLFYIYIYIIFLISIYL